MGLNIRNIRYIIFDMDDTLFDTNGQLVQPATREACAAMIEAGLNAALEECLEARKELAASKKRSNVYHELVKKFRTRNGATFEQVAQAGFNAFHDREIKEQISPFPDTRETLSRLSEKYKLFLVTLGAVKTQKKKVELLGLAQYFDKIYFSDVANDKNKRKAFKEILELKAGAQPEEFLAVGNRIDSEIREAKELGMQTLLMEHGEYLHLVPQSEAETPDEKINKLSQLLDVLK